MKADQGAGSVFVSVLGGGTGGSASPGGSVWSICLLNRGSRHPAVGTLERFAAPSYLFLGSPVWGMRMLLLLRSISIVSRRTGHSRCQ